MRVLVTGADGFIGSHVVEAFVTAGHDVRAMGAYNSFGTFGWLDESPVRDDVDTVLSEIRDADSVRRAVDGVDVVAHLAALIAIPFSYEAPRSYVETNVVGTLNVMQAAAAEGAAVLHTSTSEVYGTPDSLPITEAHPLRAQSPYAASKIGADAIAESMARTLDTRLRIIRPFNTYGPRQSLRAVIPTVLAQLLRGPRVVIGDVRPRRDFTFVTDTAAAFVAASTAAWDSPHRVVQLGTGTAISIGDLVAACGDALGVTPEIVVDPDRVRPPASEVEHLESDPALAAAELGWHPTVDLRDGLTRVAAFLEPRLDQIDADRYHR